MLKARAPFYLRKVLDMLIIANGTFKSGSTWLMMILQLMTEFPPPPDEFRNPNWHLPSIKKDRIKDFFMEVDYQNNNFLSKNHFSRVEERDLILSSNNVLVLGIKRDIRDVIVSAYYHDIRNEYFVGSFADYFWGEQGRERIYHVKKYNDLWNLDSERLYTSSYEALHTSFFDEVQNIASFLNIKTSEDEINLIKEKTDINALKHQKHFRKGIVGDWKNYLSPEMLEELRYLYAKGFLQGD